MLTPDLVKNIAIAVFSQVALLFAGIVVFGLLMHFISRLTFESLARSFGRKGTYFFAWLGTPIHESGHALFCLIFAHKITDIALFKPDPVSGTLGYVYHKWNPANPWQALGNFFIGVGPVILGCAALLAAFYLLIPDSSRSWDSILAATGQIEQPSAIGSYPAVFGGSWSAMLGAIFDPANLASWRSWVFLYLAICIGSNIRLSTDDLKGAFSGLGYVILFFLLLGVLGVLSSLGNENLLSTAFLILAAIYSLFMLALVIALAGFILTYLISAISLKVRRGSFLNPF